MPRRFAVGFEPAAWVVYLGLAAVLLLIYLAVAGLLELLGL